jgi:methionyl-tRNA formyltransferase
MKLLLAGTPSTSVLVASAVATAGHEVVGVLCPFPKPVGRKKIVTASQLEQWAVQKNVPIFHVDKDVLQSEKLKTALPPADALIVADFGYLIPSWLLHHPKYGGINLHPSLLPRWRGATPVPFTLLFGDKETGMSIIQMNEQFDMGAVISQEKIEVLEDDATPVLLERCFEKGATLILEVLKKVETGTVEAIPQPKESPTPMTRKFTKQDGFVPVEVIRAVEKGEIVETPQASLLREYRLPQAPTSLINMYRALHPWPGIWSENSKKQRVKILHCSLLSGKIHIDEIQRESSLPEKIDGFPI